MQERMRSYETSKPLAQIGKIEIIVPTDYLRGAMKLSMEYEIGPPGFSNRVEETVMTRCRQDGSDWPDIDRRPHLISKPEILDNLNLALRYLSFVYEHLDEHGKSIPLSFSEFCERQNQATAPVVGPMIAEANPPLQQ